ncbi:MAG: YidC/Oxa1 family membrane protein insertase [Patescibacteria group bacterium]|jgi:YidC/Oxa1 family membrane protein insertase
MFTTIFYQPVLNLLIWLYNIVPGHDIALAILALTVIIKAILWPLSAKSIASQKAMQTIQPKIDALKKKYPDPKDKEAMTKEMMALYKEEKVNPFSSCLPLLIQLPFFWAIFKVFRDEFTGKASGLVYPFLVNPGPLNTMAFGFLDFSKPNIILAVLAGAAQFWQAKMMPMQKPAVGGAGSKDESMAAIMNKQMLYIFPVLTVVICWSLPAGLTFYWLLTTVLTIVQQKMMFKKADDNQSGPKIIEGEVVR